jgi:hypothetical protein
MTRRHLDKTTEEERRRRSRRSRSLIKALKRCARRRREIDTT